MRKTIGFIMLIILMSFFTFACKEEEVVYKAGDEVIIDGIKYRLYSANDLGYAMEERNNKTREYFNLDGTLKKIDAERIYKKNDDRVGYLHDFYYYDMLNLDKYPDLTVEVIQENFKNKIMHTSFLSSLDQDIDQPQYDNINNYYPNEYFYIDENGLAQNHSYFFSPPIIYDALLREEMYWIVVGYISEDVKEDTLILHRIGKYSTLAIAYKGLEGAPMRTLTIEPPSDEEIKNPKEYPDSVGRCSYIPFFYYPYAISNCPNLVSITAFNGYFMPLSISNNKKRMDINLAAKEDFMLGFFALDAAFYNLRIDHFTLNCINLVDIRRVFKKVNRAYSRDSSMGMAGNFNYIFQDCYIYHLYNNSVDGPQYGSGATNTDVYMTEDEIMCATNGLKYIIGLFKKYTDNKMDIVINYQIEGRALPNIVDGVCHYPYNDYILNKYKDVPKVVIFPKVSKTFDYFIINESKYFAENGYIKVKLNGNFWKMSKCTHMPTNNNNKCISIVGGETTELTLCEIDENSTYVTSDGIVLYSSNNL